mmetsp:Transcript_7981/g.12695  ORF Transcript_7981/g.12695 Transcript_7981/m.12695 type:complete len:100 (+) Transcript_7981:37-336(+)
MATSLTFQRLQHRLTSFIFIMLKLEALINRGVLVVIIGTVIQAQKSAFRLAPPPEKSTKTAAAAAPVVLTAVLRGAAAVSSRAQPNAEPGCEQAKYTPS